MRLIPTLFSITGLKNLPTELNFRDAVSGNCTVNAQVDAYGGCCYGEMHSGMRRNCVLL